MADDETTERKIVNILDRLDDEARRLTLSVVARYYKIGPTDANRSREDAAYIAMLEDAVVAAASVLFGGGKGPETEGYLSEGVFAQAQDIVTNVPRLAGAWTPPEG